METRREASKMKKNASLTLLFTLYALFYSGTGYAQQDSTRIHAFSTYYTHQNILKFGDFLYQQADYLRAASEYQRFLYMHNPDQNHRIFYKIGQCFYNASRPDDASEYFQKAAECPYNEALQDSALFAHASALYFSGQTDEFQNTMNSFSHHTVGSDRKIQLVLLQTGFHIKNEDWKKAHTFLNQSISEISDEDKNSLSTMVRLTERGLSPPNKSPFLAGFMSTLIPGTGKMYAGRWSDGIFSLLLISGTSWLAYEGFRDSGISSFKGWLFGGLSLFFHTGNVYGSVKAAQITNRFHKETLQNDVEKYLTLTIRF
jgi:tetratricopeptide (TPR) repeat protein